MDDKKQSRKYLLTINNPQEHNVTHDTLKDTLNTMNCDYWAMCDEIGSQGTPHMHVYFVRKSPMRFGTVKNRFPTAHIDTAYGTSAENRDYLLKQGKWANTEKSETSVEGSFEEFGEMPDESMDELSKHERLLQLIEEGKSNAEIIKALPQAVYHVKDMDMIRQALLAEKYKHEFRQVEVTYIYGDSSADKTGMIYGVHHAEDIYRVTNYRGGKGLSFDQYYGESVIVFEEFHGEVPLTTLLPMMDKYPMYLTARYSDKVACHTYVYFTSDISPDQVYMGDHTILKETYKAYLKRINNIIEIDGNGVIIAHKGAWKGSKNA